MRPAPGSRRVKRLTRSPRVDGWPALGATAAEANALWWLQVQGSQCIDAVRKVRLDGLVDHARSSSPVYADAYRHVKPGEVRLDDLPIMHKPDLMDRFDDWVTDPLIRREALERFVANRDNIGKPFLGKYTVWKSSGSTGNPGLFVNDGDALARYSALVFRQLWSLPMASQCAVGFLTAAGRAVLIAATDDHFASIAAWRHACGLGAMLPAKTMSILDPMPDIVAQLNAYRPAFVASYPTALELLAEELVAGRLAVQPALLWSGGEHLSDASRLRLE
jgi:phenylacetate-coenzyme A ligase PaaK-like adenylate-forming protein